MIDTAVRSYLHEAQGKRISEYVATGRKFRGLSSAQLEEKWIFAFKAYAADPSNRPRDFDAADAEYSLRTQLPPYDKVKPEADKLVAAASKLVAEQMTEDEKNEFGAEIIEQHLSERKKPN